jgi:dTDP-4-dehydrorhamnose reductase
MKILLIGANSYVGARLFFDLQKLYGVVGTYTHNQLSKKFIHLDITDQKEVAVVISKQKPDVIIHAANNANARWCEANPKEAVLLNQTGTQYIVDAANKINAKVIYISSFAVHNDTNVYGRTKKASEEIIKRSKSGYLILRPSFILGFSPNTVNDRPFNRLLKNLDAGIPAIYDTSWKFYPTYVGHISEMIKACIDRDVWNKIIPVIVPDLKTRFDTAKDILTPFGITVKEVDNHDTLPLTEEDISLLDKFNLPKFSYDQMIQKIIQEIKDRTTFVL